MDNGLSRRRQGFKSPWGRQRFQQVTACLPIRASRVTSPGLQSLKNSYFLRDFLFQQVTHNLSNPTATERCHDLFLIRIQL